MASNRLEVIAPLAPGMRHCRQCQAFLDDAGIAAKVQQETVDSVPDETWRDYVRVSQMVQTLAAAHGSELRIVLVDPGTPMGLLKSIRHWVRSYPAFILNGRAKYVGWDLQAVERLLQNEHTHPAGLTIEARRGAEPLD